MHVTTRPLDAPVALFEQHYTDDSGKRCCLRVLIFRDGLLTRPVLNLLAKLLHHV